MEKTADIVFNVLIEGSKQGYIGEKISQLEHSLQAAAQAVEAKADDETVLAALLHDIGQFSTAADQMLCDANSVEGDESEGSKKKISVGVKGHERIGAEYLRNLGFSEKVAQLVESHVPVKRYLTGKDATYYESLSGASKLSLKYQGGPFTPEEVAEFEKDPLFEQKVQLRRWDDAAKVVDLKVPDLEFYRPILVNHLLSQADTKKATVVA
ncbi:hypothetical protein BCR43DRAFT_485888 [Syncephalastrum racemosum]|uniref:HD domain-containing protein n=1 Tax=Syncephalastrum racemosum TaxID=13706 RepID=A0A1X2HNA5_SYNRA|nr:hypothetical protein BCR43DRAFT_485888 [Syncephalastrum racemosum]